MALSPKNRKIVGGLLIVGALGGTPLIVKGVDAGGTLIATVFDQSDKVDGPGAEAINTAGNWSATGIGQLDKLSAKLNETTQTTAPPAVVGDPDA